MSVTTFGLAANSIVDPVLSSAHAALDGQLALSAGSVAEILKDSGGTLPANRVFRVVAVQYAGTDSEKILGIFEATGSSGNNLTGVTAVEGFADAALPAGTSIRVRDTAKYFTELQDAVNALETLGATTVYTSGTYSDPSWITGLAGSKVIGNIGGNAGSITGSITESQVSGLAADLLARPTATGDATISGAWDFTNAASSYAGDGSALTGLTESQIANLVADLLARPTATEDATISGARTFSASSIVIGNVTITKGTAPDWSLGSDASTQVRYAGANGQTTIASFGDRGRVVVGYDAVTNVCRVGIDTAASRTTLGIVGTLGFQASSDTTADRQQAYWSPSWADNADANRRGRLDEFVSNWTSTGLLTRRIEYDGSYPRVYECCPPAAPTDADVPTSTASWSVDETGNNLLVRIRYSDGTTLKTATIPLS